MTMLPELSRRLLANQGISIFPFGAPDFYIPRDASDEILGRLQECGKVLIHALPGSVSIRRFQSYSVDSIGI
jgi:hypothetical protein